jgi:excinuclease UvrABC nuclease subunit
MAYVYRFLNDDDNVIYIGYSANIDTRIKQHWSDKGHLDKECYDAVRKIEYMKFNTKSDANTVETYLINKYKPFYNNLNKKLDTLTLDIGIKEDWKVFKTFPKKEVKSSPFYNTSSPYSKTNNDGLYEKTCNLFGIKNINSSRKNLSKTDKALYYIFKYTAVLFIMFILAVLFEI